MLYPVVFCQQQSGPPGITRLPPWKTNLNASRYRFVQAESRLNECLVDLLRQDRVFQSGRNAPAKGYIASLFRTGPTIDQTGHQVDNVSDGPGDESHRITLGEQRYHAPRRKKTMSRLESGQAAIRRWQPDRAQSIRPQCCWAEARGNRRSGTTTRATDRIASVIWVLDSTVMGICSGRTQRCFIHIGLAQQHGSTRTQPGRHNGVSARTVYCGHAIGDRHPGYLDVVLHDQRQAIKRSGRPASGVALFGISGRRQCRFRIHIEQCIDPAIDSSDAIEARLCQGNRTESAITEHRGHANHRLGQQILNVHRSGV